MRTVTRVSAWVDKHYVISMVLSFLITTAVANWAGISLVTPRDPHVHYGAMLDIMSVGQYALIAFPLTSAVAGIPDLLRFITEWRNDIRKGRWL
jgi:hypothetical protein